MSIATIFTLIPNHTLEKLATGAGLINIYLITRNSLWNWLFGIITVALYFIIFLQVKLYADMGLQLIYFIMQFYGLYQWRYGSEQHAALPIRKATTLIYLYALLATIILFGSIACILHTYTDSTTVYIDALATALGLVAQWMMSKKWIEHWWVWMLANLICLDMYFYKNLYFTTGLYIIFLFFNLFGLYKWNKEIVAKHQDRDNTNTTEHNFSEC